MEIFTHPPTCYTCEQSLPIELLARSERFISELPELIALGYAEIGSMKKISQVDAAISVAKSHFDTLDSPSVGKVFYCSFWNDEVWTEFHCAKIHAALKLPSDVSITNLRANGATGIFAALEFAHNYITANPDKGVLIVGADKVDARFVRRKFSGGIFGDGAAAMYVSAQPCSGPGILICNSPKYEIDGRFHRLDAYEDSSNELHEASEKLEARLINNLVQMRATPTPVPFLHQPGARFSRLTDKSDFEPFSGDWSKRGYLPASGLMHVISEFLIKSNDYAGPIALGEASVGLQYAGLLGSISPSSKVSIS